MIVNGIIFIGYSILDWILSIFPSSAGFPAEAHQAMAGLGGYLGIWSPILPITTLITVVTLVFGVELGIFIFKSVKWIVSHIPQVGGKGS